MINRLTMIGVGLIGGSFCRALKAAGAVQHITGFDLDKENLSEALQLGVIDRAATDYRTAVMDADLLFLAVPVCSVLPVLRQCAEWLPSNCIVTDGGSVKKELVEQCEALLPSGSFFVGGHPIAGTEHSGVAASFATLFQGRRCILTPTDRTDRNALETVRRLWEATGSKVEYMNPLMHDRVFAAVSHLPHIVAFALVHAVNRSSDEEEDILAFSAGGFRDFTRIASSDPAMWRDIAIMNKTPLLAMLDRYQQEFSQLREKIENSDPDWLEDYFTTSKRLRDEIT